MSIAHSGGRGKEEGIGFGGEEFIEIEMETSMRRLKALQ